LQDSRRDLEDVANKHVAWDKKEKKKSARTRTTKDQPLWCVTIVCATHSSLPDHALFPRYIWEDELVDYEEQTAKEAMTATADPEKKKATEKESKKATEKESKKATEKESKKKVSTTTRKPRLAVENFGDDD
jgi:hypothetical protein